MMAGSGSNQGDIFDVKRIRRLVELMNEHELAEIDLRQADQRIRLRKGGEPLIDRRRRRPAAAAGRRRLAGASGRRRRRQGRRRSGRDQEPDDRHVLRLAQPRVARRSSRSAITSARPPRSASSRP